MPRTCVMFALLLYVFVLVAPPYSVIHSIRLLQYSLWLLTSPSLLSALYIPEISADLFNVIVNLLKSYFHLNQTVAFFKPPLKEWIPSLLVLLFYRLGILASLGMFSIDTAAIGRCSSLERVQESHSRIVSTNNLVLCAFTVSSQLPHSRPLTISLHYLPLPFSLALAFIFLSLYHYPTRSSPFYFFHSGSFPSSFSPFFPSVSLYFSLYSFLRLFLLLTLLSLVFYFLYRFALYFPIRPSPTSFF